MIFRAAILSISALVCSLTGPAAFGQDLSANQILEASAAAINELPGFSADFKMMGEGGDLFADTLPSMEGHLFFATRDGLGRVIHAVGRARAQQTVPQAPIDLLISADKYFWTDTASKTINESLSKPSTKGVATELALVLIDTFVQDDPFAKDANNAESIELAGRQTVGDAECDIILIKRAKAKGRVSRTSGLDAYTDARWFIGVDDRIPRRVEHITDAGFVKMTLAFEMSSLKVGPQDPSDLDIDRPEGFAFRSLVPKPKARPGDPDRVRESPIEPPTGADPTDDPSGQAPSGPRTRLAPPFAFTLGDGSQVRSEDRRGEVTVLYFWGSWCVPCRAASALVSRLAQDFSGDPVAVYALAIREANPRQVRADFASMDNGPSLVLDADQVASGFNVYVYPSIVVINRQGELAFQGSIDRQTDATKLIEEARRAVQAAL